MINNNSFEDESIFEYLIGLDQEITFDLGFDHSRQWNPIYNLSLRRLMEYIRIYLRVYR